MGTKNEISNLLGKLSSNKADNVSLSKQLASGSLLAGATAHIAAKSAKPGRQTDVKAISLSAPVSHKGIQFGSPSSKATGSQGTSEWSQLLKQTASGGLSSAFGGGLMDIVGGIGGIIGSLSSLFGGGGQKNLPALVQFQLPSTKDESVSFSSQASVGSSASVNGLYRGSQQPPTATVQASQNQTQQITQAVKQALLTSSSLNDVIAEI